MPINKDNKRSVNINIPIDIYNEFHEIATNEQRSDANLALIMFKIGFESYKSKK